MAYAKWKTDKRGRRKILVVRWRDSVAPGGWREERRPNDRTLSRAREYAHEMERRADLVAKGFASEPSRVTFGEIWDRWWEKDGRRRRSDSKHGFRQSLEKHLAPLRSLVLVPATAGMFADKLESLLVEKLEAPRARSADREPSACRRIPDVRTRAQSQGSALAR